MKHSFSASIFSGIYFFILISSASMAQQKTDDPNIVFKNAVASLGSRDVHKAKMQFADARKMFNKVGNHRKANECLMGIALVEFLKGDYSISLELFVQVKNQHLKISGEDINGLLLIEENISACNAMLRRAKGKN